MQLLLILLPGWGSEFVCGGERGVCNVYTSKEKEKGEEKGRKEREKEVCTRANDSVMVSL